MSDIQVEYSSLIDRAALGFLQSKKLLPGFSHYDVWLHEHAVAFTVAKMMDKDMLTDVQSALVSAIENGTTFDEFKKRLKPYLMARGWWGEQVMIDPVDAEPKMVQLGSTRRLRTIFQTNLATSHAAGQWARIQSNKRALPFLKYIPSVATHKRDSHRAYYHLILPVEHELWQTIYPPNGYGCLCSVRQLTRRQALRERAEDIEQSEAAFTKQQIENSKKGILDDQPNIPMVEFTNPRTKQTVQIPADITPTFAHNHGDRLKALEALFGDKHSQDDLEQMIAEREQYLAGKIKSISLETVAFPRQVPAANVDRLIASNSGNNTKRHEAEAAAAWEIAIGDKLAIFDLPVPKGVKQPDYFIVTDGVAREKWQTLDFMFTEDGSNPFKIKKINQYFADTSERWGKKIEQIQEHLQKANIVLLDLRHLNTLNRTKLISYVLSLPETQQKQIRLIVGELE